MYTLTQWHAFKRTSAVSMVGFITCDHFETVFRVFACVCERERDSYSMNSIVLEYFNANFETPSLRSVGYRLPALSPPILIFCVAASVPARRCSMSWTGGRPADSEEGLMEDSSAYQLESEDHSTANIGRLHPCSQRPTSALRVTMMPLALHPLL